MTCPWCGREHQAHSSMTISANPPAPGDISICWACRRIGIYAGDGLVSGIRRPTDIEAAELAGDQVIQRAMGAMMTTTTPSEAAAQSRSRTGGARILRRVTGEDMS